MTRRKVWIPKPSIMRSERGIARSDITQVSMCMLSGISEAKSQNVSCAEAACDGSALVRSDLTRSPGRLTSIS